MTPSLHRSVGSIEYDEPHERGEQMTIQNDAKKLAEDTLSSSWNQNVFPVDPVAIATSLGVNVFSTFIGADVSGMIRKLPGGVPEIFLDASEPPVRRRFSCAHELGHFVKHSGLDELAFIDYRDARSSNGTSTEEVFANAFAANLLMPETEVRAQFSNTDSAPKLSGYFDVSIDAMSYRLKNLGLLR